jgi:hypothetical protein
MMAWMTCLTTLFQQTSFPTTLETNSSSFLNDESYFSSLSATDRIYSTIIDLITSLLLPPSSASSSSSVGSEILEPSSSRSHPFFQTWKEYHYYSLFLPFSKVIQVIKNPLKNNQNSSLETFPLGYETLSSSITEREAFGECCFSSDLEKQLLLLLESLWTSRIEFLLQFQSLYYQVHHDLEETGKEKKNKKRERLLTEKRFYQKIIFTSFLGLRQFPNNSLLLQCYHSYHYYYYCRVIDSSPSLPHSLLSHYFSCYVTSHRVSWKYEFSFKEIIYQLYNHCFYAIKNIQQNEKELSDLFLVSVVHSVVIDTRNKEGKSKSPQSWLIPDWKQFFSHLQCHLWNEDDYHRIYSFLIKCISISAYQRYVFVWRWLIYILLYRRLPLLWEESSCGYSKRILESQRSENCEEETQKRQLKALEEVKRLIIQAIYLQSNCKDLYLDVVGLLRPLFHVPSSLERAQTVDHQSLVIKEIESLLYLMEERGIYLRS